MSNLTAEQILKEVWPDAVYFDLSILKLCPIKHEIMSIPDGRPFGKQLGYGDTEQSAWQDAADKLTDKTTTP